MRSYALLQRNTTDLLYSRARERGQWAMLWAALTGRSRRLLALDELRKPGRITAIEQGHHEAGTRLVPISQIVGSEGRCNDFDRDFNPLCDHNRERWLCIAAARRRGTLLPPVDLVQVGDLYYVQDGHHRISVARALGEKDIEARVTVWHVVGPLPWQKQPGSNVLRELKGLVGQLKRGARAHLSTLCSDQKDRALKGESQP